MGGVAHYHVDKRSFLPGDIYIIEIYLAISTAF